MDFHTPFGSPYTNGPAPSHLGGHFVCSFSDDSGYSSSDSDSPPYPFFDPDSSIYGDPDRFGHVSPWPRYQRATAFVNAQYSHPAAAFRPHHSYHGSSNETYDLTPPLPFEQQRCNYEYASQPNPTPSYHRGNRDREPNHTASLQDFRANATSSLNLNENGARLPDTLPPLSDRVVESETEASSSLPRSSTPIPYDASSPNNNNPELKTKAPPQSRSSRPTPSSFPPRNHRTTGENSPSAPSAARRDGPRHHHSSSSSPSPSSLKDGGQRRLADAWQQLYQERKEFEEEKRALERKGKCSSRRDGDGRGGKLDLDPDGMGKGGVAEG